MSGVLKSVGKVFKKIVKSKVFKWVAIAVAVYFTGGMALAAMGSAFAATLPGIATAAGALGVNISAGVAAAGAAAAGTGAAAAAASGVGAAVADGAGMAAGSLGLDAGAAMGSAAGNMAAGTAAGIAPGAATAAAGSGWSGIVNNVSRGLSAVNSLGGAGGEQPAGGATGTGAAGTPGAATPWWQSNAAGQAISGVGQGLMNGIAGNAAAEQRQREIDQAREDRANYSHVDDYSGMFRTPIKSPTAIKETTDEIRKAGKV